MTSTAGRRPEKTRADLRDHMGAEKRNYTDEGIQNLRRKFGIEITVPASGVAESSLRLDPERDRNLYGTVYGGVLMSLMDNTAGIAFFSAGGMGPTVSAYTEFMRGSPEGTVLYCRAEVTKPGLHMTFIDAEVRDDRGEYLARARFTFSNRKKDYLSEPVPDQ